MIFHPIKLPDNFQFQYNRQYKELNIKSTDGTELDGVLIKADSAKGLVFFLHGNSGSLASNSCKEAASFFTSLHYDVFMYDYRSFGKSEGNINSLKQLFIDNQIVYNELKKDYSENKIIMVGYSLGTGFASNLASANHPKLLILLAPYYSLRDMMIHNYKIFPTFLLKYNIATNDYVQNCLMPIIDFHGTNDKTVYYESSLKLKNLFRQKDTLITLDGQGHNDIIENQECQKFISNLLR
ncbi:MAG: alpha/beta fold hydrolase [Arachidicoccus sp.]|nr:alpha/beta fold hydrolase [Arachidicoccus sp.]